MLPWSRTMFCAGPFFTARSLQADLALANCPLCASTANVHLATRDAVKARILPAYCRTLLVCFKKITRISPESVRMKGVKGQHIGYHKIVSAQPQQQLFDNLTSKHVIAVNVRAFSHLSGFSSLQVPCALWRQLACSLRFRLRAVLWS